MAANSAADVQNANWLFPAEIGLLKIRRKGGAPPKSQGFIWRPARAPADPPTNYNDNAPSAFISLSLARRFIFRRKPHNGLKPADILSRVFNAQSGFAAGRFFPAVGRYLPLQVKEGGVGASMDPRLICN